jgi:hypothetical protein
MADVDITPGPYPAEVLQFWREKKLKPSFDYRDTWLEEHAFSFSVAKVMRTDVLAVLKSELDRAIVEGIGFDQWKSQVGPKLESVGWWHPHNVVDPQTGNTSKVDPPRRLRIIFETNMRTAHAIGQWDRIQRNKRYRPYLLYIHGNSERPRPMHLSWHGLLLHADDEFWTAHFPANGWLCFPAGTPVMTPAGWTPIETISEGDVVFNGAGEPQPVAEVHTRSYDGHLIRLTGEWGQVSATPNHRFLTLRGWIRAESLQLSDVLVQLPELPSLDPEVGDVHEPSPGPGDFGVPLPAERQASVGEALYPQSDFGQVHVDPVFSAYPVVLNDVAMRAELVDYGSFALRGGGLGVHVRAGICPVRCDAAGCHLCSHVRSDGRGRGAQVVRHLTDGLARLFGLAQPLMSVGSEIPALALLTANGLGGASGIVARPLPANSLAARAWGHAEVLHQPDQRSEVDPPSLAQRGGRHGIEANPEGFVGGTPLDRFDALEDFVAWASRHCTLLSISSIGMQLHNGKVYNLSIPGESYIVPAGITHNCSCSVRSVSAREAKTLEDEGVQAADAKPVLDSDGNPTGHLEDKRVAVRRDAPKEKLEPWLNKRSGKIEMVPKGVDPGFQWPPNVVREKWLHDAAE